MSTPLPSTLSEAHKRIIADGVRIEKLRLELEFYRKCIYGKKSEKRPPIEMGAQLSIFEALGEASEEEAVEEVRVPEHKRKKKGGRRPFPADLEREDVLHDVKEEEKVCSCGCEKHVMGESVTEELEYIPARVYVKRHIRPKYVCRRCQGSIVQAPVHNHPINRCSVGVAFLAYIIMSKYGDHLPLYRLEQIFKRSQIDISRSNMSEWAMRLHRAVQPLIALMHKQILTSDVIHSDDTTLRVQRLGGAKKCYLWNYLGDHKAPYTYFDFRESRGRTGPNEMLTDFSGHLVCDAYTGYEELFDLIDENGIKRIIEVGCWAHARRYFVKAEDAGDKRAKTPLDLIGQLYVIEKQCKKECAEKCASQLHANREKMRAEHSIPILDKLYKWIDDQLEVWPESPLGKALGYAQNQRKALMRFAKDGRLEIDNNPAEQAIRPVAVGRKNWLFAGGDQGGKAAATFFTLIEGAKRNDVNPHEYLLDIFTRLPSHNIQNLDEFLPDKWKKLRETGS